MSRSKAKPSAHDAAKNSEQFSQRAPLDNALDFLLGKTSPSKNGRPQEIEVDAHTEKSGRPHIELLDAHAFSVDAKTPTVLPLVDAKTPTLKEVDAHTKKNGRPQNDRHRADKTRIHFRIDNEQARVIKVFCAEKGIELQEFFTLAGVHFIEHVDAHKNLLVDANASHDDLMMIWKTIDDIIIIYQTHTGNRWKASDDRLGREFNQVNPRIIEIGIIQALFRVNLKKINSFKYFVPSIQEAIEMVAQAKLAEPSLNDYVNYSRSKLEQVRKGN